MNQGERKSFISEVAQWTWGTLKGSFNDQQSTSQIIVDAAISCIPILGEAVDVRDLVAIIFGMADDPKKREDKWEWLALVVTLLAMIPLLGGVLKGVGKLLLKSLKEGGNLPIKDFIAWMNRIGWGNAREAFNKLDLEKHKDELLVLFRRIMQRVHTVLGRVLSKFSIVLSNGMMERLRTLRMGLQELLHKGEEMIPQALKNLNDKLKEVQGLVYEGKFTEIPKSLKSVTRKTEAQFQKEVTQQIAKQKKNLKHPPSTRKNVLEDLNNDYPELSDKNIKTFSGPISPLFLEEGKKIYRVLDPKSKLAGAFWVTTKPKDGKQWREGSAVLTDWNKNGEYIEYTVKKHGLWAYEGKSASQIQDRLDLTGYGQSLGGGETQLFIDFKFDKNAVHVDYINKDLKRLPTGWPPEEHLNYNVPKNGTSEEGLRPLGNDEKIPEKKTK